MPTPLVKSAKRLLDQYIGENYYSEATIQKVFKSKNYSYQTIFHQHQLIALAWIKFPNAKSWNTKLMGKIKCTLLHPLLELVVVDKGFQHKGIATQLMKQLISQLPNTVIYCTAWNYTPKYPLQHCLKKLGFKLLKTSELHYLKESIQQKYTCPICYYPCYCNLSLWKKAKAHNAP